MSATLLADKRPRAAHGRHICRECRSRISAGQRYVDQRIADEGTVYTYRAHTRCFAIVCAQVDDLEDYNGNLLDVLDGHSIECAGATVRDFVGCDCKTEPQ